MARMTNRLSPLVAVVLAAALLASCNGTDEPARDIYGEHPRIEEYLDSLGAFREVAEQASMNLYDSHVVGDDQYEAIVQEYRENGLEALSTDERQSLLLVSGMALLANARAVMYSLTVAENGESNHDQANAFLEEVYSGGGDEPNLAAIRISGGVSDWPFGSFPQLDPAAASETRIFYEQLVPRSASSICVRGEIWSRRGGQWECQKFEGDCFARVAGYSPRVDLLHALVLGTLRGQEEVDRRETYYFESGDTTGQAFSYWLDAETLWLRQYEYEDDGIHYTVKLEAINEDIVIEPPDVDVECVEEETE